MASIRQITAHTRGVSKILNLSPTGEAFIKSYEKLVLKAYKPTPDDVWTIGWGHTKGVKSGQAITQARAQEFFEADVAEAGKIVDRYIKIPLSQSMRDALLSIVFNCGSAPLEPGNSIHTAASRRDYFGMCDAFFLWRKQSGKDLLGLARRRAHEMIMFLNDKIPQ